VTADRRCASSTPDGSEAETSGNGLRIFARYLWDRGRVGSEPFEVATRAAPCAARSATTGRGVAEMGRASFDSAAIPVAGLAGRVVDEELEVLGERLRFTAVTVGNPHCVILVDEPSTETDARAWARRWRAHPLFPRRTNVQFVRVVDRRAHRHRDLGARRRPHAGLRKQRVRRRAASVRLGLCEGAVTVAMPGGELEVASGRTSL
jgi:diaminopimelate epimerase